MRSDLPQLSRQGASTAGLVNDGQAFTKALATLTVDAGGIILDACPAMLSLLGYERSALVGQPHALLCPEEELLPETERPAWRRAGRQHEAPRAPRRVRADGVAIWPSLAHLPVPGADGMPLAWLEIALDTRGADEAQRELLARDAALERSQAVIEFDLDGCVLMANGNFLRTFGYQAEEVIGRHHRMFCPTEHANSASYLHFWEARCDGASSAPANSNASRGQAPMCGSRPPTTRCWAPTASRASSSSSPWT